VKPLDVTDKAATEHIGRELAAMGGVHILVNNAGVMPPSPCWRTGPRVGGDHRHQHQRTALNYSAVLSDMARRKAGHIVDVSSVCGRPSLLGRSVLREQVCGMGRHRRFAARSACLRSSHHRQAVIAAFHMPEARIRQDANAILYAVSQPSHVNVGELVIRPSTQEL